MTLKFLLELALRDSQYRLPQDDGTAWPKALMQNMDSMKREGSLEHLLMIAIALKDRSHTAGTAVYNVIPGAITRWPGVQNRTILKLRMDFLHMRKAAYTALWHSYCKVLGLPKAPAPPLYEDDEELRQLEVNVALCHASGPSGAR